VSKQERLSWVGLLVNVGVGTAYFGFLFVQPHWQATAFTVVPWIILVAVLIGTAVEVALSLLFRRPSDAVGRDERDWTINLRGWRNAYFVLAAVIFYVIARILLAEIYVHAAPTRAGAPAPALVERLFLDPVTPTSVMLLLLFAMTVASCAAYASRIAYYRFGLELKSSNG
jgi:hypothetical protein